MAETLTHVNLARGFRGGERQTELLVRELVRRGVRQRVVTRRDSPLRERLAGLPRVECRAAATPWIPRPDLLTAGLVHAHESKGAHLAHLTNRLTLRPYLVTRRAWEPPGDKALNHAVYGRAAAVVAISRAVRDTLHRFDRDLDPVVIHSAADPSSPDPGHVRALRHRWNRRFVVGHVGALVDRHKGQTVLIAAARRLERAIPRLTVVFLGKGPDERALREAARGSIHVEFEGFVEDVASYLAAFDLFVFPSRYEALGSTLLDAMSAGLPVVASAVDGIPELVRDGEEGLLVPAGDDAALARAIHELHDDPERRRRYGEAARLRAGSFSASRMADRYLELYQSIAPGVLA